MTSNDPSRKNLVLEIQGEVVVDVGVEPRNIAFKQLSKGQTGEQEITIKVAEPDKTKIVGVTVSDPRFELEKLSGDFSSESKWRLKFKGDAVLGTVAAKLVVDYTTNGPQKMEVPVRASIVGDLVYQKSVRFIKDAAGSIAPRKFLLRSRTGKTVEVTKIEDLDHLLKIDMKEKKGEKVEISLSVIDPNVETSKPSQHKLSVHTKDADEPVLEITYIISAQGKMGRIQPGLKDKAQNINLPK